MPDEPINDGPLTESEINELVTKIKEAAAGLGPRQLVLAKAMIKMASEVDEVTVRTSRPVLGGSSSEITFKPGAAQVVLSYASDDSDSEVPAAKQSQVVNYITR